LDKSLYINKNQKCVTYAVTNQKRGVAKTTVSVNLTSSLAFLGQKVLLIDLDSQSQSSKYLNKELYIGKSLVNILNEILQTRTVNKKFVNDKSIDILPSELRLSKIFELCRTVSMPHTLLKKIIDTVKDSYDIILLDLAPTSGISIEQALFASDKVILATDCDEFSKEGIKTFNKNVQKILLLILVLYLNLIKMQKYIQLLKIILLKCLKKKALIKKRFLQYYIH